MSDLELELFLECINALHEHQSGKTYKPVSNINDVPEKIDEYEKDYSFAT